MARKQVSNPSLQFHPLTPERWDDFAELFGERGACGGCWCMVWRLKRSEFEQNKGAGNREAMHALIQTGPPPGILAYAGERAVGWCAVAPRAVYPALARSRVLKPLDALPVWSVTCLFVARDQRKQGVSVQLLRAAIDFVREQGGEVVEGYPIEPRTEDVPAVFAWTGLISAFTQAGFHECARGSPTRPIMRFEISRPSKKRRG
jgi:GNAT superfamily N-acetyltransferase